MNIDAWENKAAIQKCWKRNDWQQRNENIEAAMVSTPDGFTNKSPMQKYIIARKSPRQFLETLDVKPMTAVHRFSAAKSEFKAIRAGSILWSSTPKSQVNTKINERV